MGAMGQAIISADLEGFRAGQLAYTELGAVDASVGLITRIGPRWTRVDLRALERQLLPCQWPTRRERGELGSVRPSTEIGVLYVRGGNSLRCVQHLPTSRRQISHFRARPRWCRIG